MSRMDEFGDGRGRQTYAIFVVFGFLRRADTHFRLHNSGVDLGINLAVEEYMQMDVCRGKGEAQATF
jgi:hypothetical protein